MGTMRRTSPFSSPRQAGTNPRALAELIAAELRGIEGVADVEVAGPGFLNITVDAGTQGQVAADIVAAGAAYGRSDVLKGERINVEFISANPTGPLHLGHTRWAAVGDALARVLEAAGAEVAKEFYINDRGSQMDLFGDSILARALGEEPPEDGYQGEYVHDLAQQVLADNPGILELPEDERRVAFREEGYRIQLANQQAELAEFHTTFDVWFSERGLHGGPVVSRRLLRNLLNQRATSGGAAALSRRWRSCGGRGICTTPTGRCGCGRPTSATTRTGC